MSIVSNRMRQRKASVRNLEALYEMGEADIVVLEKSGTISFDD